MRRTFHSLTLSSFVHTVNAVLGNLLGVVLTPYLLRLVGTAGALSAIETLQKLATRVVLPLTVGQLLRSPLSKAGVLAGKKKMLSRTSESLLLLIVYSTFCDTFLRGFGIPATTLCGLLGLILAQHACHLVAAWQLGGALAAQGEAAHHPHAHRDAEDLALGLPLLRVVFAGRPDLGVLCTPLLIQHPLQLFVGSVLSPKLKAVAEAEED